MAITDKIKYRISENWDKHTDIVVILSFMEHAVGGVYFAKSGGYFVVLKVVEMDFSKYLSISEEDLKNMGVEYMKSLGYNSKDLVDVVNYEIDEQFKDSIYVMISYDGKKIAESVYFWGYGTSNKSDMGYKFRKSIMYNFGEYLYFSRKKLEELTNKHLIDLGYKIIK